MDFIFVYITAPSEDKARKVAKHLLEKRLIACANIFPIRSLYRWKGEIKDESEHVVIAKTAEAKYEEVKKEVEEIHPYDVPCITKVPVSPNQAFSDWIEDEVQD